MIDRNDLGVANPATVQGVGLDDPGRPFLADSVWNRQ